jgi:2,5-furandicarboxylate decarboxylase 1
MALSLRDFLAAVGPDLIRIKDEVDPITQAGALCSAAPRPILLENLRGFPGWQLCDILVKDRARQALALGTSPQSVVRELSERMFTKVPGQSKLVGDGPCKEVKLIGEAADITTLPIPIHSEGDAGRYLGSGITLTKDPDTGIRNEAIIRALVKGPRRMGFWMAARHNWAHLTTYQERHQPAPMAFAIGLHPGYEILANYSGRHEGYDELEMGAGVLGETIEMVKCETIDLEVPAHAEVIIEGIVPPGVREPEGPFGEFTGYSKGAEGPAPVFEVTAITRRRDPIYRHMQATLFTDHQPLVSVPMEASLYRRLRETHGHTDVHDVYIPPWVTMFTVFIQMTARWDGQARAVLQAALSSPYLHPKIAIAVDEDVDIYDPREVFWAISTRLNPEKAVAILTNERIHPLDISVPNVDKSEVTVMRVGGKLAIDATKPPLWRTKERAEYTRVRPKGVGDPALQDLLRRLGAMAR